MRFPVILGAAEADKPHGQSGYFAFPAGFAQGKDEMVERFLICWIEAQNRLRLLDREGCLPFSKIEAAKQIVGERELRIELDGSRCCVEFFSIFGAA
jgi:hypothetical protein